MALDGREWLETDGLGGFASGTVSTVRTRRYHGLLLVATTPPTGRMMLVNGFEAWLETDAGRFALTTQRYAPDVLHPDGAWRLDHFQADPWPTWRWRLTDDAHLTYELFVARGLPRVVLRWRLSGRLAEARLHVRPLLSGRDYHALHHENAAFDFTSHPGASADAIEWHPYAGVPGVRSRSNGTYTHAPDWYRRFLYLEERSRGLDDEEDLATPGELTFDVRARDAVWMLEAATTPIAAEDVDTLAAHHRLAETERRRAYPSRLHRAADQYVVRRGAGCTIVAGYPWFTDWGRDTFIALRGLCLATGRISTARRILLEWADQISEGMLPNRFPDAASEPEYNSVDASLWFIAAVQDLLRAAEDHRGVTESHRQRLIDASIEIVRGYSAGTRYGIREDFDGLLSAGEPGVALTWMDARIGEQPVTPRIGKPVEVQALWLNALAFCGEHAAEWHRVFERALPTFQRRFWNPSRQCLYDVIDVDHVPGRVDGSMRPNQILAIGGLPRPLLHGPRALQVVEIIERTLLTPMGLRTLAPGEPGYTPHYDGTPALRDGAYHQGTAWPWLMGAFVEAWVRVHGGSRLARQEARSRFVRPLLSDLDRQGLGHLPEIADAEAPFTPRGAPFQAWSLGEFLRVTTSLQKE